MTYKYSFYKGQIETYPADCGKTAAIDSITPARY